MEIFSVTSSLPFNVNEGRPAPKLPEKASGIGNWRLEIAATTTSRRVAQLGLHSTSDFRGGLGK